MSKKHQSMNNKNSKVNFKQYLYGIDEPDDYMSDDIPPELSAQLLEDSFTMKRRIRQLAKRIRKNNTY